MDLPAKAHDFTALTKYYGTLTVVRAAFLYGY